MPVEMSLPVLLCLLLSQLSSPATTVDCMPHASKPDSSAEYQEQENSKVIGLEAIEKAGLGPPIIIFTSGGEADSLAKVLTDILDLGKRGSSIRRFG